MLAHIVLFTPRTELAEGDRHRLGDALSGALARISSIRRCRVGRRVRFGFGYEEGMREHYEYVAILDFDDAAGLEAYLEHPAHEELSRQFYATVGTNLAYDYEMLEGTDGIAVLLKAQMPSD